MSGHIATPKDNSWCTPETILKPIREVFGGTITLDPCHNPHSTVDAKIAYSLPFTDGLLIRWCDKTFVNPPYNVHYFNHTTKACILPKEYKELPEDEQVNWQKRSIKNWIQKAHYESLQGNEIIMLIPAAVGTKAWHDIIFPFANSICFLKGRVRFVLPPDQEGNRKTGPAPMDTALIYFGYSKSIFKGYMTALGNVIDLRRRTE